MKSFTTQHPFYKTNEWKHCRAYVWSRDRGLCQDCLKSGIRTAGKVLHHIKPITEENINNPDITLNPSNLVLVCMDCHAKRHGRGMGRYFFGVNGEIIEKP